MISFHSHCSSSPLLRLAEARFRRVFRVLPRKRIAALKSNVTAADIVAAKSFIITEIYYSNSPRSHCIRVNVCRTMRNGVTSTRIEPRRVLRDRVITANKHRLAWILLAHILLYFGRFLLQISTIPVRTCLHQNLSSVPHNWANLELHSDARSSKFANEKNNDTISATDDRGRPRPWNLLQMLNSITHEKRLPYIAVTAEQPRQTQPRPDIFSSVQVGISITPASQEPLGAIPWKYVSTY